METSFLQITVTGWTALTRALDRAQPLGALIARAYVSEVFFSSGLTKLHDWDTTLALFHADYHVPLLPPAWAAVIGTAGELILPLLLLVGFGGRFAALGLGVVNAVAVISLSDIAPAALQQHVTWGVLLAMLALFGPLQWSVDRLIIQLWLQRLGRLTGEISPR